MTHAPPAANTAANTATNTAAQHAPAQLMSANHGGTLVLTMSNPEFLNALDPAIVAAGIEVLNAAESNPDVKSVVLTGADGTFCAGGNLQRLQNNRHLDRAAVEDSVALFHSWIEAITTFPKPIVAAVQGAAAGAGFSIALACDLVVAADNAKFVMAYSNVGLSPDGGGTWQLSKLLPRQLAMQLMLLGEKISAQQLHTFGVVNAVCEHGAVMPTALALAERLNARAGNANASIKELAHHAAHASLHEQLALEQRHFAANLLHPNAAEGMAAFFAKRPAHYPKAS